MLNAKTLSVYKRPIENEFKTYIIKYYELI